MSLLSELTSLLEGLIIPVETGVFTDSAPDRYTVLIPLTDTFKLFADNFPNSEIQEVRVSLFDKGNYLKTKNAIVHALLSKDITITDRRYVGYESDTGYHHYAIDVATSVTLDLFSPDVDDNSN